MKENTAEQEPVEMDDATILEITKRLLLKLLNNDSEVRDSVIAITTPAAEKIQFHTVLKQKESEILQLRKEIELLKAEKSKLETESAQKLALVQKDLTDQKAQLTQANDDIIILEKEKDSVKKEVAALKQRHCGLDELEHIYSIYTSLPQNIKTSMAGFVRGETLLSFMATGMRDSKLEMFWEFCRTEVQKSGGLQYAKEISSIFEFFFTKMNGAAESALYALSKPKAGERLNEDEMTVSNSSSARDGIVENTVLCGYFAQRTKKIIKKPIVTIIKEGR